MSLVKFLADDSVMEAEIFLEGHRVRLTFKTPVPTVSFLTSIGFVELNENNHMVMSDFSDHKYIYHEEVQNYVYVMTNEPGDIWEEQPFVPPTPPEPYIPTLEEVKAQKVAEMESTMSANITAGITVTLSDGSTGTFGLSALNQTSLTNLRLMAEQAEDKDTPSIPWHISDEGTHCKYFSPNDIMIITNQAIKLVTYNVTLLRDLRIYINSLETKSAVEAITYDISILPYEYWSDVLKDIVVRMQS